MEKLMLEIKRIFLTMMILFGLTRCLAAPMYRPFPEMESFCWEPLAQLVERLTFNQDVQGSNP